MGRTAGAKRKISEELDRVRRAERDRDWEAHRGWEEYNWMIYSKDTGRFLYIVATLFRHIQAKSYKDTNTEKRPKNVEAKWIGV